MESSGGRVTGTPPAVVHTLRETRGSSVLRMPKSLTKKKKSPVGWEATRLSSSGSAFLIPTANSLTPCPFSFWAAGSTRSWDFPSVMRMQTLGTPGRASWGRKTRSATWRIAAPVRVLPPL